MNPEGTPMDVDRSLRPLAPYLVRAPRKRRAGTLPPSPDGAAIDQLWGTVRRRWRIIAGTVVALVGTTAVYCLLATPIYKASALVLIESRAPQVLNGERVGFDEVQDPFTSGKYDYYQTQFSLLRSRAIARRVVEELDLVRGLRKRPPAEAGTRSPRAASPGEYLAQIRVIPVRGTRLVSVGFKSPDPKLAAEIANAHARAFVRSGLERLYVASDQIRGFLQSKLSELQWRMQEAEMRLMEFQRAHALLPVNLSKDVASERLMELNRRLTDAEAERIAREAEYRGVAGREPSTLPTVLTDPLIQRLRESLNALEVEHALLAAKFRPTYPRLRQLTSQLAHARRLLRNETAKVVRGIEARWVTAENAVAQLREEIDAQRAALIHRKDAEGDLLTLAREAETTRALYDNLLARVKDLDVAAGANTSNVSIAEPAHPPKLAASPATGMNLLLSLVVGLLLGPGLAFLRDAWDGTVQDSDDLRRVTGLGTLAVIPDLAKHPAGSLPAAVRARAIAACGRVSRGWRQIVDRVHGANGTNGAHAGNGAAVQPAAVTSPPMVIGRPQLPPPAEAYRMLRTALLLHPSPVSPHVILVASAASTEGKTTTALNTAAALATCGASVLLIDGDLRLSRCHESLGVPAGPGLSDWLLGADGEPPICGTHLENLSFLPAGRTVPNPTELLSSWRMWKLLQDARERYGFVVIDSPPLLAVSDALLLANLADGVIVVAERGRSRRAAVRDVLERLEHVGAVPLGAVLNRGPVVREQYRYAGVPGGTPVDPETNGFHPDAQATS